jgi:4-alpha-glucanotransferase
MGGSGLKLSRCGGILLHVTSLPGRGIGDLGEAAYRWIDWLADAGQSVWQILPLVPVNLGGSPYNGLSALGGNALLVSPDRLAADGLLAAEDIGGDDLPSERVDFPRVSAWKEPLLRQACGAFRRGAAPHLRAEFGAFRSRNADWVEDYALFRAVREAYRGAGWVTWEAPIRLRLPAAVAEWRERLAEEVEDHVFRQFLFERQWQQLRRYAQRRGISIVGDIPIFVAHDSADVWAHRDLFSLDEDGLPAVVSGVPPDYFSVTGQRWGNPLYRWDVMARRGYEWWTQRFRRTLEQVDIVRVDHFRGFEACWEIPAQADTALHGQWVAGPRTELFEAVAEQLGSLPIIAEDLGLITPEVERMREQLGFPGMRVLQFAFDGDPRNPHLPANYATDCVAYTGTHDNATLVEWWLGADPLVHAQVRRLGPIRPDREHWDLIELTLASAARMAVVPLQDVLGLGAEARMNTPGVGPGNWGWRVDGHALEDTGPRQLLRELVGATGRVPPAAPT